MIFNCPDYSQTKCKIMASLPKVYYQKLEAAHSWILSWKPVLSFTPLIESKNQKTMTSQMKVVAGFSPDSSLYDKKPSFTRRNSILNGAKERKLWSPDIVKLPVSRIKKAQIWAALPTCLRDCLVWIHKSYWISGNHRYFTFGNHIFLSYLWLLAWQSYLFLDIWTYLGSV